MTSTEQVILVDFNDNPVGTAEKLHAHQHNLCHRAFSVFILRNQGTKGEVEVLLQQRASDKYHSPNLWTNTCCSHPRPSEETIKAGARRLKEEMGIDAKLQSIGWFHYIAHFDNGLVENEVDHVLIGFIDQTTTFQPNRNEVQNHRWVNLSQLKKELEQSPHQFTPWLKPALKKLESHITTIQRIP